MDGAQQFAFEPGQFVSCVAEDPAGKQQVRAYSIASAPDGNRLDLCVNRVDDGFFSNRICDLQPGDTLAFNGPLGTFILESPPRPALLVATGTGIAPLRGFVQSLFRGDAPAHPVHLIYGTRYETEIYYREFFEQLAARRAGFTYEVTLSRAGMNWPGSRGYVQEAAERWLAERGAQDGTMRPHAYLCGFRDMITAVRTRLLGLGWEKRQISYERYD